MPIRPWTCFNHVRPPIWGPGPGPLSLNRILARHAFQSFERVEYGDAFSTAKQNFIQPEGAISRSSFCRGRLTILRRCDVRFVAEWHKYREVDSRSHVGVGQLDDFVDEHGAGIHAALADRNDAQRAQLPPKKITE